MNWNFIGKGSAFYPLYGNTGAYLLWEKELYLLDCGEAAFDFLYRHVDLDAVENVYVILTHLHADHVGSLGTLISYYYCLHKLQVHVVHPEETAARLLALEGLDPDAYHFCRELPENKAGLRAVPVKVRHVDNMECYGYLLSDEKETIYYSGDACEIPAEVKAQLFAGKLARIYQDTSTHDSAHPTHCYYGRLEAEIPPEWRERVYCMHLDSPCEELLKEKGFQVVETPLK
ncbi:MAG TPA: MBL fold metallo-hydrolase [Candidatus Ventrimonas merdavium]|nr:MBL fold metallo-hydrolase [Candidatus Ventrimonas merdavium]